MSDRASQGRLAEEQAFQYLLNQGLTLVEKNYRSRYGEIDLIMQNRDTLVFVEVRYRRNNAFGGAIASIDYHKQQRIKKTALHYMQQHNSKKSGRFDVIAISDANPANHIDWISNAFE